MIRSVYGWYMLVTRTCALIHAWDMIHINLSIGIMWWADVFENQCGMTFLYSVNVSATSPFEWAAVSWIITTSRCFRKNKHGNPANLHQGLVSWFVWYLREEPSALHLFAKAIPWGSWSLHHRATTSIFPESDQVLLWVLLCGSSRGWQGSLAAASTSDCNASVSHWGTGCAFFYMLP